ncbi:MAG: hypothetical protein K1X47_12680 [Cyclobacteriaceae bacterium]|nr:hypothetical protein [Cyclobacteriaceae bacterium]
MTLTDRFLQARHWQLFLLAFGIPILFQFFIMGSVLTGIGSGTRPDKSVILSLFSIIPIVMVISMGTMFGWFWSIVIGLQHKLPETAKIKTGTFKVLFFIPLIYLLFFLAAIGVLINGLSESMQGSDPPPPGLIIGSMLIIFPIHLFAIFCIFHSLFYVAKTIKTIELQRPTTFSDFAGEFLLIWFYFIGIWIIQPKVNRMAEGKTSSGL